MKQWKGKPLISNVNWKGIRSCFLKEAKRRLQQTILWQRKAKRFLLIHTCINGAFYSESISEQKKPSQHIFSPRFECLTFFIAFDCLKLIRLYIDSLHMHVTFIYCANCLATCLEKKIKLNYDWLFKKKSKKMLQFSFRPLFFISLLWKH